MEKSERRKRERGKSDRRKSERGISVRGKVREIERERKNIASEGGRFFYDLHVLSFFPTLKP